MNTIKSTMSAYRRRAIIFAIVLVNAVSGMGLNLTGKLMNRQIVEPCLSANPACQDVHFRAPWFQCFVMYLGQLFVSGIWWFDQCLVQKKVLINRKFQGGHLDVKSDESFVKAQSPVLPWAVPACLNVVARACYNYGTLLTFASTVDMLRNCTVICTAFISLLIIRRALRAFHWIGVLVLTAGLLLSSLFALMNPDSGSTELGQYSWVGVLLSIIGTLFTSLRFLFEERIFNEYYASAFLGMAYQALMGITVTSLIMVVGELSGFEKTSRTLTWMAGNNTLVVSAVFYALTTGLTLVSGMLLSKMVSAVFRTVTNTWRTVVTWIVELILGWNEFDALNMMALCVLMLGSLTYTNLFKLHVWLGWIWWVKPIVCCKYLEIVPMADVDDEQGSSSSITASSELSVSSSSVV